MHIYLCFLQKEAEVQKEKEKEEKELLKEDVEVSPTPEAAPATPEVFTETPIPQKEILVDTAPVMVEKPEEGDCDDLLDFLI